MVVTASNWFSKHMFKAVENLKNMFIKIHAYAMLCLMPIIWNARETVIPRLAKAAQEVTGMPQEELMESFGVTFVSYVSRYGYDKYAFAIAFPLHI